MVKENSACHQQKHDVANQENKICEISSHNVNCPLPANIWMIISFPHKISHYITKEDNYLSQNDLFMPKSYKFFFFFLRSNILCTKYHIQAIYFKENLDFKQKHMYHVWETTNYILCKRAVVVKLMVHKR